MMAVPLPLFINVEISNLCKYVPSKFIKDISIACGSPFEPVWKNGCSVIKLSNPKIAKTLCDIVNQKRFFGSFLKVVIIEVDDSTTKVLNPEDNGLKDSLDLILRTYTALLVNKIRLNYLKNVDTVTHKTKKCYVSGCKKDLYCINYHSSSDKRREIPNPFKRYSAELCSNVKEEKVCPFAEKCIKAHNYLELEYHPSAFKDLLCSRNFNCSSKSICPDAHLGTSDSIYQKDFKDTIIIGLESSVDFLVNAVRLMYKVDDGSGVQVMFVTSTQRFTKFVLDVLSPIAQIHHINVLDSYPNTTQSQVKPDVLVGTPASLLPIVSEYRSLFNNVKLLIADDISALLYVGNKLEKFQTILNFIKSRRKDSNKMKQVVVAEECTEGIRLKASRIFKTDLKFFVPDRRSDGKSSSCSSESEVDEKKDVKPRRRESYYKKARRSASSRSNVEKDSARRNKSSSRDSNETCGSSHSDEGSCRHSKSREGNCHSKEGFDLKKEQLLSTFIQLYTRVHSSSTINSEHFKSLWRKCLNNISSSGNNCKEQSPNVANIVQDNSISSSSVRTHAQQHYETHDHNFGSRSSSSNPKRRKRTLSSNSRRRWSSSSSSSDFDSFVDNNNSSFSAALIGSKIKRKLVTKRASESNASLRDRNMSSIERSLINVKTERDVIVILSDTGTDSDEETVVDRTIEGSKEKLRRETENKCQEIHEKLSTFSKRKGRNLKQIHTDLRLTKGLLVLKDTISQFSNLKPGFDAFLDAFQTSQTTSENVLGAFKDEDMLFVFELILERLKQSDKPEALQHCRFILDFKKENDKL